MISAVVQAAAMLVVRDPEDGAIVGELPMTTAAEVAAALDRGARAARRAPASAHARADVLERVAARVAETAAAFADIIATEGIKTIREAETEVARCILTLRLAAEQARRIGGAVIPFDQVAGGEGRIGWYSWRPAGLVIAITPFNDPLNLVAHKLGPAFALGAPVILKPHPQTPYSALRLVAAFHAAGAEPDSVQIVIGGAEAGAALVADPRGRIVSFTGGHATGAAIARIAGIKRLMLELGGVGIVAVAADADIERAIDAIHGGAFWAAGQNCVHAQRIIADARIVPALRAGLIARAGAMRLGPKRDRATDMGPLVDAAAARRVIARIERAQAAGARILTGGTRQGTAVLPTWIEGLPPGDPLLSEEIFGPVATIETAVDTADILSRLASAGGAIHAAIFTASIDTAMAAYDVANAAGLIVNDSTDFRIDAMPFGGVGAAGLGREGVADAIEAMAEKKLFILHRADPTVPGRT